MDGARRLRGHRSGSNVGRSADLKWPRVTDVATGGEFVLAYAVLHSRRAGTPWPQPLVLLPGNSSALRAWCSPTVANGRLGGAAVQVTVRATAADLTPNARTSGSGPLGVHEHVEPLGGKLTVDLVPTLRHHREGDAARTPPNQRTRCMTNDEILRCERRQRDAVRPPRARRMARAVRRARRPSRAACERRNRRRDARR